MLIFIIITPTHTHRLSQQILPAQKQVQKPTPVYAVILTQKQFLQKVTPTKQPQPKPQQPKTVKHKPSVLLAVM